MASITVGKLYKRGDIWYFRYTDHDGRRSQRSTGKTVKREATIFAQSFIDALNSTGGSREAAITLREEIARYKDVGTNPRYRQAKLYGKPYTLGYAKQVARHAVLLETVLDGMRPPVLDTPVASITRRDLKEVQLTIVEKRGHCRTAQHMFRTLKTIFSHLVDDGVLSQSPALGMPDIGYDKKKIKAIEAPMIAWMISQEQLFPSPLFHAYVTVLASTGMRRSEALAIDAHHITDGTLLIDQQVSPHHDHPVPPKWRVIRAIPLPRIALGALSSVTPDSQGRYFSALTQRDVTDLVRLLKAALCAADPENRATWSALTLHTLRHSANTNLLVAGCSPVLVAEYLAWKHQELVDMQRNYTHMVAMNLKPVADMMDILCTPKAKMRGNKTIVFQGNG